MISPCVSGHIASFADGLTRRWVLAREVYLFEWALLRRELEPQLRRRDSRWRTVRLGSISYFHSPKLHIAFRLMVASELTAFLNEYSVMKPLEMKVFPPANAWAAPPSCSSCRRWDRIRAHRPVRRCRRKNLGRRGAGRHAGEPERHRQHGLRAGLAVDRDRRIFDQQRAAYVHRRIQ